MRKTTRERARKTKKSKMNILFKKLKNSKFTNFKHTRRARVGVWASAAPRARHAHLTSANEPTSYIFCEYFVRVLTGSICVMSLRRSANFVAVHDFVDRCDSDIPRPLKAAQTEAPANIDGV